MIPLEAIKSDSVLFDRAVAQITPKVLGSVIDHTALGALVTRKDVERLCAEAEEIGSFVCVNAGRIADVKKLRKKSPFSSIRGIAAVTDFPFGAGTTAGQTKQNRS